MSQISKYPLSQHVLERIFEIFLKSFIEIKNKEEADQFLSDLLTPTEKVMLAKRLTIAFLLEKGYDYQAVQKIVHVSTATIASVNLSRQYGSKGYTTLLTKITKEENLSALFDDAVSKFIAAPAALEKGQGTWSYVKQVVEKKQKKRKKVF